MDAVVWLSSAEARNHRIGGKGRGLATLVAGGFRVPLGFALRAEAYEQFATSIDLAPLVQSVLAMPDLRLPAVARAATQPLSERLSAARLSQPLVDEIGEAYRALRTEAPAGVAVRSSALSEDAASASSAGLYESYLGLTDEHAVCEAVLRCYRSLWSVRAVQYRALKGLDQGGESMAVVVMALVPAEVAGVVFTADPVSSNRDHLVVNASWGLGESVVSGRVTPDSFTIRKSDLALLRMELGDKHTQQVHADGGTREQAVEPDRQHQRTLSDAALRELGRVCLAVESQAGQPMDIEFAFANGALFILQARPITNLR